MRLRSLVPALVVMSALLSPAGAQDAASIGRLRLGATCPLIKREYPRLLLTRDQLPAIRARLSSPEIQTCVGQARDLAKAGKAPALLLAALYQLTQEKPYADMAKAKLGRPAWYPEWALTYDLVAETMTDAERRDLAKGMLDEIRANQWRPRLLLALAAWGNGLDAELTPFIEQGHAQEILGTLNSNNHWTLGRGGSSMGHGYNGEHFFSVEFDSMLGWTHATGDDVLAKADFADQEVAWYVYHYLPWQKSLRQVIRVGVTMSPSHVEALTPNKFLAENTIMLHITRTKNGLGQWWQRAFLDDWPVPRWRAGEEHVLGLAGRLLWLDPAIPSVPPEKFPETRLFPVNGHVIMRSDWGADATVALFRCGRFGEIDGYWGRNNADNLHFIIYRDGYLAPDTGTVHNENEGVWKMLPNTCLYRYTVQTVAHNSITVGRAPIEYRDSRGGLTGTIMGGGQTPIQKPEYFKAWGLDPAAAPRYFKEGDITAYSTSPAYDYACGDATHSYPPERVKSITRQFVYLKPDLFVVFDRVTPAEASLDVVWNLHALTEPAWNGKRADDPAWTPERQFIIAAGGRQVANPHPGGHFLHTAGDTFRVDNGKSVMTVRTLLPAEADRVVRTVGGRWHDFEVDGVNYGPTDATYEELDRRRGGDDLAGVGGWRIEVSPARPAAQVQFLHVLQTGASGSFEPADVTPINKPGREGAKITLGSKTFEIAFNTQGPVGGHLNLTDNGKGVLDEDLVTAIEDHYDRWKSDPRYREWMTNEFMRIVIFPYGKKP